MRGVLLIVGSLVLTSTVIGNAYYQKKQFYPSVVYITKSNPSMAVIYVQAFVLVILMGKLMRKVFFGQLRAAELEHLIERSWYAVTETCLAFTVFRDDFSPKFVALFTLLLFLKCFHWLADDRVDYMERSPVISVAFHARVISLLLVLGLLDAYFVNMAYYSTLTKGASVQLVFGFEYAILWTTVFNIIIKYMLHAIDLQSGNPWENKAVYLLYTELIMGFIKVVLYMTFMLIMIRIHTFPLFAIRPMYLTLRAFKKALNDVIMSRRAIRNMNTLYPDATSEELASVDNVCIICRDEMVSASKKLPCNHIFHTSCLRSWFQRQQTCPTCRLDVLQTPAPQQQQQPAAGAGVQQAPQPQGLGQANGAHLQPPQLNAPMFYPAPFPPGFPFWAPLQQPFPIPPQPNNAGNGGTQNEPSSSRPSEPSTGGAVPATGTTPPSVPSPFFFPPFPFLPHVVPPPKPPANFSGLTENELHEMEGQERHHVEARIQCLRNIQTLLDAAVMEMQQYSAVVATLGVTTPVFTTPPSSSAEAQNGNDPTRSDDDANAGIATAATGASNGSEKSINSTETVTEENVSRLELQTSETFDEKEQLRRRRLQRFGDQQLQADNGHAIELD